MDDSTAKFNLSGDRTADVHALMSYVLSALKEKGYNPINQLVGYIVSNYKGARGLIKRIDRDELLEVIINDYCSRL